MTTPYLPTTPIADLAALVDPNTANHVAWFYRPSLGYRPGSFIEKLIGAIANADLTNRAKLSLAFPEYVAAVTMAADYPGGLEELALIARRR